MPATIITTEDLSELKRDLLKEIKLLLKEKEPNVIKKEWLKSTQVIDMLSISPGTLKRFRDNGTLSFTKIGGLIFYEAGQIEKILLNNLVKNKKRKK